MCSYACGGWVNETVIPADKPLIARSFDGAAHVVHEKLRSIYEAEYDDNSPFRPLADFYSSCMNTSQLEELGAAPLSPMLERIDRAASSAEVGSIIADFIARGVPSPVKLQVASAGGADKVLFVNGGGFILPDASFYRMPHLQHELVFALRPDPHAEERQNLQDYYYRLNLLAGYSHEEAMHAANATIGLETVMAHWTLEEPPIHEVILDTLGSLESVVSSVPWRVMFASMVAQCEEREGLNAVKLCGAHKLLLGGKVILLGSPKFLSMLELMIRTQDPSMWVRYLRTHYIFNSATLLDSRFLAANLEMDSGVTGIRGEPARQDRCVKLVSSSALSALSERAFVQRFFPKESKEYTEAWVLLKHVKAAFIANLKTVAWMDAATQKGALDKADKMALNLGGPPGAYANGGPGSKAPIEVDAAALLDNAAESSKTLVEQQMQEIGMPMRQDAGEWSMTATTVNAYYDGAKNAMFVPAGTLQPPFFALGRPAAMNFGAIGAIMGHEMTHGFDLQGALLDADGQSRDWWSLDAANQFKRRSECVDTVFNVIGAPRLFAQPQTLSEDLADVGGVKVAMMAYQKWHTQVHGVAAAESDLREFFLAFSQNWCVLLVWRLDDDVMAAW